jgi:hypothetical protein
MYVARALSAGLVDEGTLNRAEELVARHGKLQRLRTYQRRDRAHTARPCRPAARAIVDRRHSVGQAVGSERDVYELATEPRAQVRVRPAPQRRPALAGSGEDFGHARFEKLPLEFIAEGRRAAGRQCKARDLSPKTRARFRRNCCCELAEVVVHVIGGGLRRHAGAKPI